MLRRGALALMGALSAFAVYPLVAGASTWVTGDVFAGTSQGRYQIYSNAGVFKETLTSSSGFTTGCAHDSNGDFYGTYFDAGTVIKFDKSHPHNVLQTINTLADGRGQPESIVFAANGDFYVGGPFHSGIPGPGSNTIARYNSAGAFQQSYSVASAGGTDGPDWIDLAADQTTMFYEGEGRVIKRFSVAGAGSQLPDFATLPGTGTAFAFRLLPPGDGSGGVLVADQFNIKRLDGAGNLVQTYDFPGADFWFALNLDPNGTSFWSGDAGGGNFYRFNIATGAVEVGPINATTPATLTTGLFGLCVAGEQTAAMLPGQVSLTPATATNPVGTNHTITATVTRGGAPLTGVLVTFTVTSGANAGTIGTATTNALGQASVTYTSATTGTDTIVASFDDNGTTRTSPPVTKTWTAPSPPPPPPGDGDDGELSCRATGVRIDDFADVVSNRRNELCREDDEREKDAHFDRDDATVTADLLQTSTDDGSAKALAEGEDVVIRSGGNTIRIGSLRARATADCRGGDLRLSSSSRVEDVTVNGEKVTINGNKKTIKLRGGPKLTFNERSKSDDEIVRRAVYLDNKRADDVIVGEARAGGDCS